MSLISLKNLSFSYRNSNGDSLPILKNINLEIQSGELVAIQGPSGSGKSTLLYIIGCLLKTYSGQVQVGGTDIATLNEGQLAILRNRHIGFVFQQFYLLPKATVLDNVLLPSYYPTEAPAQRDFRNQAQNLLKKLGLEKRLSHFPNQLSGGQQQRVSIARALLNETQIILADEPTGSLDTQNSKQTLQLLKDAHAEGRTVIIITHDPEIAQECERIVHFRDGEIQEITDKRKAPGPVGSLSEERFKDRKIEPIENRWALIQRYLSVGKVLAPLALQNIQQNKSRSLLTMLGIVIGVAAVLSMLTVGSYTKQKILESYADLGVNTLVFYGDENWKLKATDQVSTFFRSFDWARDIAPLKNIFPEIERISPMISSYGDSLSYGGQKIDTDPRVMGISEEGLLVTNRNLILGTGINSYHVKNRSPVCVIGYGIYERFFTKTSPLNQMISIEAQNSTYGCRVIGVAEPQTSNKEYNKPNFHVYLPYTYFQGVVDPWYARARTIVIKIQQGQNAEESGKKIKALFELKYGKSGRFNVGSDSVLISQMNRFLSLFTILLGAIALVSLAVGGIGITNMMLVSVSERFKEIGIRKAFGATNFSIRVQYLIESIFLCGFAGAAGLVLGFALYQGAIYGATKFISSLKYEWIVDLPALILSILSILAVGILSGLTPAYRAQKLEVIEALRSE